MTPAAKVVICNRCNKQYSVAKYAAIIRCTECKVIIPGPASVELGHQIRHALSKTKSTLHQSFGNGGNSGEAHGMKRALLCGVTYRDKTYSLKGTVNDVKRMKVLLMQRFGYRRDCIRILTETGSESDFSPTKKNIQESLKWLVEGSESVRTHTIIRMPWLSAPYSQNLESSVDVNDKVGGRDNKASSISSSQEDQAQKQKHEQQHAASVQSKHQPRTQSTPLITVLRSSPSKQEADSRDNEIISRGTSTEHSMHKEESHVQSKHDQPRTEAPTVLRSPSKQGAADSRDNEIISRRTTEHPVHKEAAGHVPSKDQQPKNFDAGLKEQPRFETSPVVLVKEQYPSKPPKQDDGHDNKGPRRGTTIENHDHVRKEADMPKDHQALLRQKENGGVTNINPDPPVNNNPITVLNINVYVDQPKSVDKNDIAIKKNKAPDPKPQNGIVSSKPPSERKCCCTIL